MQAVSSDIDKDLFLKTINDILNNFNLGEFSKVIEYGEILLTKNKNNTFLLNLLGVSYIKTKKHEKGQAYFKTAIKLNPQVAEYYNNLGASLNEISEFKSALDPLKKAITINPVYEEALCNLGNSYRELFDFEKSKKLYMAAIQSKPNNFRAMNALGFLYLSCGEFDQALDILDKSINISPSYVPAYLNKGLCLSKMGDDIRAISLFKKVIELDPKNSRAYNNISLILSNQGQYENAIDFSKKSIHIDGSFPEFYNNLGNCYLNLQKYDKAIDTYKLGISIDNSFVNIYFNLVKAYIYSGEFKKASSTILGINNENIISKNLDIKKECIKLISSLKPGEFIPPLTMMPLVNDYEVQYLTSKHYSNKILTATNSYCFKQNSFNGKIKIGYFSADFKNHPVMHLLKKAFSLYDKDNFEVFIFSFGNEQENDEINFLKENVKQFFNVKNFSDKDIIKLSRDYKIEIAVDLMGYTQYSRPSLFVNRLAPIQVNYLGYPGTFGSDCMDYIVGDKIVIPENKKQFFSEKIIYMPDTYLISDDSKNYDFQTNKTIEELPEDKFIFCCFNNGYKISDQDLDHWSRILLEVKESILWLAHQSDLLKAKLLKKFKINGVDSERIIFAKRVSISQHLARHKLADLFLDTSNYNAHTTAIDAVNGCLPILTLLGNSFPSRVAGSVLTSLHLETLITLSEEEYIKKGILLGKNKKEIDKLKNILKNKKDNNQLLNTQHYIKKFEKGLIKVSQNFRTSLPKNDIYIK